MIGEGHMSKIAFIRVDGEFGFHFGIAAAKASLLDSDHEGVIIDTTFCHKENKEDIIRNSILKSNPDVVGFCVTDMDLLEHLDYARTIKKSFPEITLLLAGAMPTVYPRGLLSIPEVDAICMGDGENLPAFLTAIEEDDLKSPPAGFVLQQEGRICGEMKAHMHGDLDSLNFIDYGEWRMDLYKRFYSIPDALPMITSRGCPYSCSFCSADTMRKAMGADQNAYLRHRSPLSIIDEIQFNLKRFKGDFKGIQFDDAIFGSNKKWFAEFVELYREHGLHEWLPWTCQTRGNILTEEWVRKAKSAGCVHIRMGIEHWDESYRHRVYQKEVTNTIFREVTSRLHEAGIYFNTNLIIGGPHEAIGLSLKSLFQTLRLNPFAVTYHIFRATPGLPLVEESQEDIIYRNGLPRIFRDSMHPILIDLIASVLYPVVQRIRASALALRNPHILKALMKEFLQKDQIWYEDLGPLKQSYLNLRKQQIMLEGLYQKT